MDDLYDITDDVNLEKEQEYSIVHHAPPEVEWFHGKISREEASSLLSTQQIGSYLVRESLRDIGDYSISFRVTGGVKHFKVIGDEYGGYFIADTEFSSLSDVIERYCNECLSDNLTLRFPLKPRSTDRSKVRVEHLMIAQDSYEATGPDEISFQVGDRLVVLKDTDPHWLWVTLQGRTKSGFAPRTLLKEVEAGALEKEATSQLPTSHHRSRWLHTSLGRPEAEKLLSQSTKTGAFLIRESSDGGYSLSFKSSKRIQHIKISMKDDRTYECGGRAFDCLEAVVLRYMREPLVDETALGDPIPPVKTQEDGIDIDGDLYSTVQYPGQKNPKPSEKSLLYSTFPKPKDEKQATLKNSNAYVKTGFIVKKNPANKKWKQFYFTLFGAKTRLYYFDTEQSLKPRGIIDLQSSSVFSLDDSFFGRPNCFQIVLNATTEIFLCCDTEPEKMGWISAIGQYCASSGIGATTTDPKAKSMIFSLDVSVMEAKGLSSKVTSPYCVVSLNGVKHARTPWKPVKNASAFWSEDFTFDNISSLITEFSIELFNHGKRKDQSVGTASLELSTLKSNEAVDKWVDLCSEGQVVGSLRFKATYLRENVLPIAEYNDLKKLLFSGDVGTPLLLAELQRASMNDVARNLLLVWRSEGREIEIVTILLTKIVESEENVATLFRGNSLASKAVDQYMKMVGIPYLHKAIGGAVRDLFESKQSCELDPMKGGKPDNVKPLLAHCNKIVADVFDSLDAAPGELCTLMANLRAAVTKKFPKDELVRYTAVSAFLFLRLICPAIMNPKLFNMMPDHPTEQTARSLTLVAKVVQNLANMAEFGQKESHMTGCNEFLASKKAKMQQFLDGFATAKAPADKGAAISPARPLATIYRYCVNKPDELKKLIAESKCPSVKTLSDVIKQIVTKVAKA